MRHVKNCDLACISDSHFCIIRGLGPVKGGKGLKHHEVVVDLALTDLCVTAQEASTDTSHRNKSKNPNDGPKTETKARGGVRTRSGGDPRQVGNSHQTILTRER